MRKTIAIFLAIFLSQSLQATPINLYEQLCEVNQEWIKNYTIAQQLGLLDLPPIKEEQDLLVKHIQLVEMIFKARTTTHLAYAQQQARKKHLEVLNAYWHRRDCPKNYYLSYRNPVFIDHEGRYCAVGYLMLKSGLKTFCEAVQKTNNFIFIRQIEHPTFHQWQEESGLSIDELAWIQPGYVPVVNFIDWDKRELTGKLVRLDSMTTLKIYNPYYDQTDMFDFQYLFWGVEKSREKLYKKYAASYKGKQPDWNKLTTSIKALTVYKNEIYVVADTIKLAEDDTLILKHKILKWNKKGQWETVFEVKEDCSIHCFFESRGRLYAGGGKYIMKEMYPEVGSFLASTNGTTGWKVSTQEFGGVIFGLVYKNKKRYLGTVYNTMSGERGAQLKE